MPKFWSKISSNWRNWSTRCKRRSSSSKSKTRSTSTSTAYRTSWSRKTRDWPPQRRRAECTSDSWPASSRANGWRRSRRCCGGRAEETSSWGEPKLTNRSLIRCSEEEKSGNLFFWFSFKEISWRVESRKFAKDFARPSIRVLIRSWFWNWLEIFYKDVLYFEQLS